MASDRKRPCQNLCGQVPNWQFFHGTRFRFDWNTRHQVYMRVLVSCCKTGWPDNYRHRVQFRIASYSRKAIKPMFLKHSAVGYDQITKDIRRTQLIMSATHCRKRATASPSGDFDSEVMLKCWKTFWIRLLRMAIRGFGQGIVWHLSIPYRYVTARFYSTRSVNSSNARDKRYLENLKSTLSEIQLAGWCKYKREAWWSDYRNYNWLYHKGADYLKTNTYEGLKTLLKILYHGIISSCYNATCVVGSTAKGPDRIFSVAIMQLTRLYP